MSLLRKRLSSSLAASLGQAGLVRHFLFIASDMTGAGYFVLAWAMYVLLIPLAFVAFIFSWTQHRRTALGLSGVVLAISALLLGVCVMVSKDDLYRSLAEAFSKAWFFWIPALVSCLGLAIILLRSQKRKPNAADNGS